MTRLIEILISLAIVAALFLLVSLVLPSERNLQEKVETNRKMTIVYDTLNSLRRFGTWNPLTLRDPKVELKLSGPESGKGARLEYDSSKKQIGSGSWEIVESVPNQTIKYALENNQRGDDKTMTFTLKPTGRGGRNVEITQDYHVEYGWSILGRYAGLYVSRHVGDDMKMGLQRLSNMLASVPNVDYKQQGSRLENLRKIDLPAEDLLVVEAGSIERNNLTIQNSMKSNMEWINRTIAENKLEKAGPMRIISTELGRENYTFDVVQPVRRAGSGGDEDEAADEGDDQEETAANGDEAEGDSAEGDEDAAPAKTPTMPPVPVQAATGEPLEGLKLLGPVKYVRQPARSVATGTYVGFMAELENVRNAVRAWALTQGFEPTGRPYEVYKNGIDKAFTADENNQPQGQFDVYWDLKAPGSASAPAGAAAAQPAAAPATEAPAEAPAAEEQAAEEPAAEEPAPAQ